MSCTQSKQPEHKNEYLFFFLVTASAQTEHGWRGGPGLGHWPVSSKMRLRGRYGLESLLLMAKTNKGGEGWGLLAGWGRCGAASGNPHLIEKTRDG